VTTAERISRYIGKIPGAVSGNGGHRQTFKVAMVLFNGFGCSEAETIEWLRHYNSKCEPPWSEAELRHKARSATEAAYDKPRGWMLTSKRFSHVRLKVPVFPGKSCPVAGHGCHGSFSLPTQHMGDSYSHEEGTIVSVRGSESTVANVAGTGNASRNRDATDAPVPPEPVEPNPTENSADLNEARRIADELLKLHHSGAIKGPADVSFFARLIRDFCATYTAPKRTSPPDPVCPYVPTAMQRVRVPSGLSLEERQSFLQKDLDDAIGYEDIAALPPFVMDLSAPRKERR
jgi:hypothetical protein